MIKFDELSILLVVVDLFAVKLIVLQEIELKIEHLTSKFTHKKQFSIYWISFCWNKHFLFAVI
jgi:hypothetical protein